MIISALTSVIALSSCTMEKQHYSSGYNVQWNGKDYAAKTKQVEPKSKKADTPTAVVEESPVAVNIIEETVSPEVTSSPLATESASISSESLEIIPQEKFSFITPAKKSEVIKMDEASSVKMKLNHKRNASKPGKAADANGGGDRSWIVALLLCFFLGGLGLHRFYLGYNGIGLLMLFTGGVFGVLWLIDFFRILFHSLKPKDGDYK